MSAQQIATPDHRRTTLIVIGLLLVALAVGAVTAVKRDARTGLRTGRDRCE